MIRAIIPPYLLARIATLEDPVFAQAAGSARQTLLHDPPLRQARESIIPSPAPPEVVTEVNRAMTRTISTAENRETLPGRIVRREGDPAGDDIAVNEAYDGLGASHALFSEEYGRDSVDGRGLALDGTVHYGRDYDNAFWDGTRMVFGDGDGQVFTRFTASLSVIGHELTHGVTQHTAGLVYQGQSGALSESVSDVFGALIEQRHHKQQASEASWLIGVGLFTELVEGSALRSLLEPGTAYDDDVLGRDPQPGHMSDYIDTSEDNGGVHLNSGIPNRAFALTAVALGGNAWDRAGQIWYDTLTGELSRRADFESFAQATLAAAGRRFGEDSEERSAVLQSWQTVGVLP